MYNLLVVDDVVWTVQGITQGIDWSRHGINGIYEAYNADMAMDILRKNRIDILICDIEMPETSGLQLLEWMKEHAYSHTETILLTGYADFEYAQKAVSLGGFEYLLKPVKHERLQEVVDNALQLVKRSQQLERRFWHDVLAERSALSKERLEACIRLYNVPLRPDMRIFPILICVDAGNQERGAQDPGALCDRAGELILAGLQGHVIQERSGAILVLVYEWEVGIDTANLVSLCQKYVESCRTLFQISPSYFIGHAVPVLDLAEVVKKLYTDSVSAHRHAYQTVRLPEFVSWGILLETGEEQELCRRIGDYFAALPAAAVTAETLEAYHHGLFHLIYSVFNKKGLSMLELDGSQELTGPASGLETLQQLKAWSLQIATAATRHLQAVHKSGTVAIGRVRQYVEQHITEEFTREDIAAHIHLNPTYLSRMFKKETGVSLSDYVIQQRMQKAKKLLEETNLKVVHVAEAVGYYHLPHFTTMFKKVVGITPQHYRKAFRDPR